MVEEVGSKVDIFQDPDVEKVLCMYLLSVRHDNCNRGIGKKLVLASGLCVHTTCIVYKLYGHAQ